METKKVLKLGKVVSPTSGSVTMFIEDVNWGPIVTGKDEEEASEKFKKALRATCIANTAFNLADLFKEGRLGEGTTMEVIEESKKYMKEGFSELQC